MRVLYLKEKSRSGDRSTGEVSGESRHWGKLASGGSRDREIAPTGEVSGERSPSGEVSIYGESRDREIAPTQQFIPFQIYIANTGNLWVAQPALFSQDFHSNTV